MRKPFLIKEVNDDKQVKFIAYIPNTKEIYVQMMNEETNTLNNFAYVFKECDERLYKALENAKDKGDFVNKYLLKMKKYTTETTN